MIKKDIIRDFYGHRLGTIETDTNTGDKIVRDFYGKLRGRYIKRADVTKDFYGKIVARGDQTGMLLPTWENQRSKLK